MPVILRTLSARRPKGEWIQPPPGGGPGGEGGPGGGADGGPDGGREPDPDDESESSLGLPWDGGEDVDMSDRQLSATRAS